MKCCGDSDRLTHSFHVDGMSCQHCVKAIEDALAAMAGVQEVEVDLQAGKVSVNAEHDLCPDKIADVIEEAGYEVRG